jgi:hypothetical protein
MERMGVLPVKILNGQEKEVSFLPDGDAQFALFALESYGVLCS